LSDGERSPALSLTGETHPMKTKSKVGSPRRRAVRMKFYRSRTRVLKALFAERRVRRKAIEVGVFDPHDNSPLFERLNAALDGYMTAGGGDD
jgi:hypothetical protein